MAKSNKGATTLDIPGVGKVEVPQLEPTDHTGVVKIAPDVAGVFRQVAEMYNKSILELLDPYLRPLAAVYLEQMKAHIAGFRLSDTFKRA